VDQKVARDAMLDMTRSITDGMATLGEPYAAASNNGQVKLVLEPRGSTGYHGVYSTAGEIRIVGGANSFGHEWTHAIDHTVAERLTGNPAQMNKLLSQYARDGVLNPRDGVQAAMAKLINIHFYKREAQAARQLALEITAAKTDRLGQPTQGALEAQRQLDLLERGGSLLHIEPSAFREASMDFHPPKRGYYGSIMELLGRSHEAYLAREMQNAGVDPRGFVMPDEAYINETDRALKMLYPKADDRSDIFAGWAEFHRQMRNEMVLSQGKPPGAFSDLGISDPSRLSVTAPMSGGTALAGWLREEANRYANFTKNLAGVGLYDKSRPDPGDKTLTRRIADTFRAVGFASHSMAETIIKRAPEGARPYLREIMDRWTPAPGEGRYTGASLEEARQNRETEWLRRYGNILNKHGLDPRTMTNEENDMIRHVMTTGEDRFPTDPLDPNSPTKPIPANLIRVAGKDGLRPLLDEGWATSDAAGLDTGYAKSGYFPRLWDIAKIFANPARFREAAGKLHALIFDQEVGAPGKDPTALLEKWTTLSGTDRDNAPAELATQMEQLAKSMRRQRQIEEQLNTPFSSGNPVTLRAELAALKTEIQQQAEAAHALLRDHIAETASGNWFARLMRAGHHDFDTVGPSGKYLNARVLPPETDTIMREFLRTNINDAIPNYLIAVARRTADAERFGAHGEDLDRLLDAAARVPGMDGNDLIQFENLTNNVRGRISYRNLGPLQKIHNAIQTYGAVVTMPRALWASLAEPMNGGLATGEMRVPFKIFASQFGQLMRTASSRERSELADFLNVTTSPMHDTVMLSRMSADYSDSPLLNRLMGWYYRVTGLTQLTNSQRIGATAGGDWFLNKLAQHYQDEGTDTAAVNRRDNATRWFRELGLNDPIHADFAKWMTDKNGALPSPHQLLTDATGMAGAYGLAMRRLVNRIIQQPTAADRPMMARVPIIGLAYQLMHFNYQFARNVLNPAIGQVEHAYSRARAQGSGRLGATAVGAGAAVHAASMAGAMVGVGLMTTMVRQALFAPDQWKKHEEDGDLWDYLLGLAMQRSGLNGTLDPIIQVATNLRYNADLSSLLDGASMNWIAKNAQDVIQPLVSANDSPNTNTRYFNAARGAFNLIGVPAAAIGLTTLGAVGGPISRAVAGAALQYGTSPASASGFAGMVAGEKGAQLPKETKPGELPELPGPASLPSLPSLSSEQDQSAQDQGAGGGLLPWGLMDDVAVPAWRVAAPMLSRLPGPVKAGALGLGALTGAKSFLDTTAPWRGEDARPPKAAEQAAQP
jgi:hypothetical protein